MKFVLVSITVLVVCSLGRTEDKCKPPRPGEKHIHASECCKVRDGIETSEMTSEMSQCMDKLPHMSKPPGPRPSGGPPPPPPKEMKILHVCFIECVFKNIKLLKDDNTIDESAFKTFSMSIIKNDDLKSVVEKATTTCLASYKENIDRSSNCTSGSANLQTCVTREIFLHCPDSMWTSSTECNERKAIAEHCPHEPIMLLEPPPHHQH